MYKIEQSFFEEEEREGFVVSTKMKRFWAAEIEVLLEIQRICEKYDISYFADWGTLLGAVRHEGFIPWDDDLDVGMLRDDWNRFMEVAPVELEHWFELKTIYTDEHHDNVMARLITGRHMNFDKDYLERFHYCPFSVGVDIFAVDYIPRDKEKATQQIDIVTLVMNASASMAQEPPYSENEKDTVRRLEELTGCQVNWENRLFHELKKIADIVSAQCNPKEADEVGSMMRLSGGQDYYIKKDVYKKLKWVPFEYIMVPIPEEYDNVLKLKYGETYMTPRNISWGHEYPIYKEQELALKEVMEREFNVQLTLEDVQMLIDAKVREAM